MPETIYKPFEQAVNDAAKTTEQFKRLNNYITYQKENGYNSTELRQIEQDLLDGESSIHYLLMVEIAEIAKNNPANKIQETIDDIKKAILKSDIEKKDELIAQVTQDSVRYIADFNGQLNYATAQMEDTIKECTARLDALKDNKVLENNALDTLKENLSPLLDKVKAVPDWIKTFVQGVSHIVEQAKDRAFYEVDAFSAKMNVQFANLSKNKFKAELSHITNKQKLVDLQLNNVIRKFDAKISMQQKLFNMAFPGQLFDSFKIKDKTCVPKIADLKRKQIELEKEANAIKKEIYKIESFQNRELKTVGQTYSGFVVLPPDTALAYQKEINDKLEQHGISPMRYSWDSMYRNPIDANTFDCSDPNRCLSQVQAFNNALDVLNSQSQIESLLDPTLSPAQINLATALYLQGYKTPDVTREILKKDPSNEEIDAIYAKVNNTLDNKYKEITNESIKLERAAEVLNETPDLTLAQSAIDNIRRETMETLKDDPLVNVTTSKPYINYLFTIDKDLTFEGFDILTKNGIDPDDINTAGDHVEFATMDSVAVQQISQFLNDHSISHKIDVAIEVDMTKHFIKNAEEITTVHPDIDDEFER